MSHLGNLARVFHQLYKQCLLWSQTECPKCPALSEQSWKKKKNTTTEVTLLFCGSQSIESCTKIQCIKVSHAEKPLTMWAYLTKTRSNHPQRLFLPVVTPTSLPLDCKRAPVSWISVRRTDYSAKTIADLLIGIFNYYIKFSRIYILFFRTSHLFLRVFSTTCPGHFQPHTITLALMQTFTYYERFVSRHWVQNGSDRLINPKSKS